MLNIKRNLFWIFLLPGFFSFSQGVQFNNLNTLAGKLIRSLRSDRAENIFIHTDKSVYKAGDNIWLEAYVVNKISHRISHQSKIVFVDLVNERDSVISQLVLDVKSLRLEGNMPLPVVLEDGNYWLRGYTNNILQNDSADICVHPIYIVNQQNISSAKVAPGAVSTVSTTTINPIPKFEIYPEGGSLVSGTNSLVAFSVSDQNNNPLEVSGYVKDNRDSIATTFKTSFPGVGKFLLFPWKIRKYTVYIKIKGNREFSFPLPVTNDYSAQLSVVSENEKTLRVRISLGDSLYGKKKVTYLLGISRDSLCFAGVGEDMYEVDIQKKNFPQGEATLILFDQKEQILSERSIYIDLNSTLIDIKPDKENYQARQNAVLNLTVTDRDNQPALSLFSVSVTDNNSIKNFYDEDIETVMKKPYSPEERDLMMLVQKNKYRKWKLTDTVSLTTGSRSDENFFNTRGTVLNQKKQPVKNIIVNLLSTDRRGIFKTDTTDENGRFDFQLPGYGDSSQFILQATDRRGETLDLKIIIDSVLIPKFNTPLYLKKPLPASSEAEIIQKRADRQDFLLIGKGKELREVIVKSRFKPPVNYDVKKRVSQFSRIITSDMIQDGGPGVLSNSLFMVPGVHMRNGSMVVDAGADTEPIVVMDGVVLDSSMIRSSQGVDGASPLISFLNGLSPSSIDFIEVLNGPEAAFYGVRGGNGVIVINTLSTPRVKYTGNQNEVKRFYPRGYSSPVAFTEPDYNKKEIKRSVSPDQRSTIYWSGQVITNEKGKATINFFTADSATTYTVTIKGITSSGDIILRRFLINRR